MEVANSKFKPSCLQCAIDVGRVINLTRPEFPHSNGSLHRDSRWRSTSATRMRTACRSKRKSVGSVVVCPRARFRPLVARLRGSASGCKAKMHSPRAKEHGRASAAHLSAREVLQPSKDIGSFSHSLVMCSRGLRGSCWRRGIKRQLCEYHARSANLIKLHRGRYMRQKVQRDGVGPTQWVGEDEKPDAKHHVAWGQYSRQQCQNAEQYDDEGGHPRHRPSYQIEAARQYAHTQLPSGHPIRHAPNV